jgi:hypothetical protein
MSWASATWSPSVALLIWRHRAELRALRQNSAADI